MPNPDSRTGPRRAGPHQRRLWVTGPDYYLDVRGQERRDLEPDAGFVPDGWWTCARSTRAGDLVLLHRSRVKMDVSHLLVARSDAGPLDLPHSPLHGRPVPEQYWRRLFELAGENRGHLEQQAVDGLRRYRYEKDVPEWLFRYPGVLETHGLLVLTEGRKEILLAAAAVPTSSSARDTARCGEPSSSS